MITWKVLWIISQRKTHWFQGEKPNRLGANGSPIINHLLAIPQILNQLCVPLKKNLGNFLPYNYKNKNLGLFHALRTKSFANQNFLQWWCQTPHMTILWTLITNQHGGSPCGLLTQHTMKFGKNNYQIKVNLTIHMRKMTLHMHMILPYLTISTFQQ
jgi:hypothetical protein